MKQSMKEDPGTKGLSPYLKPYKRDTVMTIFCIEAEIVFELITPLVMASIMDVDVVNRDRRYILMKGLQMALFALISLVLGQDPAMPPTRCGQGLGAEIRKAEFTKLQQLSFININHFSSSSLVTRLTSDVVTIRNFVVTGMRLAFRSPAMMLTAMAASLYINPQLVMVFLVAAPVLGALLLFIINRVRPLYSVMQGVIDMVNRIIQENLTAIRVVKSHARGDYGIQKFEEVNCNLWFTAEKAFRLAVLNMPAMRLVMYSTILCILWSGGRLVAIGGVKVGELTGSLSYVPQVLNSLMMFSNVFLTTTRALASWRRILEAMSEEIDIKEGGASSLEVEHDDIRFEHMYLEYNQDAAEYAFFDISFHIKAGQIVDIIGRTNAVKSALVQLAPRLYDVANGMVYIDGRLVREYPLKGLRDSTAMVLQKSTLFSGTVKDNPRWGKRTVTDQGIREVCRIACVDEFIDRLKHGYETKLDQEGVNVSDGQKQRLCTARAILKSPRVPVLDDSTSAVDTATEIKTRDDLAKGMPDTAKIIIAQRISFVVHVDQIIILEDGRVNAAGSHETLLASNQIYQDIYHSQQEGANL